MEHDRSTHQTGTRADGSGTDSRSRAGLLAALAALPFVASCTPLRPDVVQEPAPPLEAAEGAGAGTGATEVQVEGVEAPSRATEDLAAAASEAAAAAGAASRSAPGDATPTDTAESAPALDASVASLREEVGAVLDDWHEAASVGARDRYIGHFALDAVFLGTDRTERWDLAEFTSYVDQYFEPGKGWTFTPVERFVVFGPSRDIAWFDERLDSESYGDVRGTGVLRRTEDGWRIAHYSMTFTVPNGIARDVVDVIRAFEQ
ncbi:MAG: nuclear transport factor 2 family protein [Planctomycetota bacterium]